MAADRTLDRLVRWWSARRPRGGAAADGTRGSRRSKYPNPPSRGTPVLADAPAPRETADTGADADHASAAAAYAAEFAAAIERAAIAGFPAAPGAGRGGTAGRPALESLVRLFAETAAREEPLGRRWFVGRCFEASAACAHVLRGAAGVLATPTLGYVVLDGTPLFRCTPDQVTRWTREGVGAAGGQFHVWLTEPGGHLIDVTLPSTVHTMTRGRLGALGDVLVARPDDLPVRYHPLLAGAAVDALEAVTVRP